MLYGAERAQMFFSLQLFKKQTAAARWKVMHVCCATQQ